MKDGRKNTACWRFVRLYVRVAKPVCAKVRNGWIVAWVAGCGKAIAYSLIIINKLFTMTSMIQSFASRETAALFAGHFVRRLPPTIAQRAAMRLRQLDAAERLDDLLTPASNRLEKLSGDRQGQHSIRINDQWRVCFVWRDGHAWDVEIVDYH